MDITNVIHLSRNNELTKLGAKVSKYYYDKTENKVFAYRHRIRFYKE